MRLLMGLPSHAHCAVLPDLPTGPRQDAYDVQASKMVADAEAAVSLILACRAVQATCPLALHYDLEGGTAASITNMTTGAGQVHGVLARANLTSGPGQAVGLHFDSFTEWSSVGSTVYPCAWAAPGQAVSINECLLRANATRLLMEDYRAQAEDFNASASPFQVRRVPSLFSQ
jgi:hypothetical protein